MDRIHADRPDRAARHEKRTVHRIHAAAFDQHPARVCRRFEESGSALGRQQSRCIDRQGGTAGLGLWLTTAFRNYGDVWVERILLLAVEENDRNYKTQHSRVSSGRLIWKFDRF